MTQPRQMRLGAVGLAVLLGSLAAGPAAQAAEAPVGADNCSGCHGAGGVSVPVVSLAGRPQADMLAALEGFRAGTKPATVMDRITKGFSPDELRALATWFAQAK